MLIDYIKSTKDIAKRTVKGDFLILYCDNLHFVYRLADFNINSLQANIIQIY